MLCDDVTTDTHLLKCYDGFEHMQAKIQTAHKFVLSKDFAVAADGLVENLDALNKVAPLCHVPFPLTWIEFLHDDRPHWDPSQCEKYHTRPVDPTRHQGMPSRVGYLLEQQHNAAGHWLAHLFWRLRETPTECGTSLNSSLMCQEWQCHNATGYETAEMNIAAALTPRYSQFGVKFITMLKLTTPDIHERLRKYAEEDWGGELRFLLAILGLLNARNVTQMARVDNTRVNKSRVSKGKRPLHSHTVIKVRPFIIAGGKADIDNHKELKLHLVRGHFKHKKNGLFWWSMHARGSSLHGVSPPREYELKGA
jgi:hypothetical protein